MPSITIDGNVFTVREGMNLLEAVLSLKLDLPYFCWHPALGSVGACRQCAVLQFKDEKDTKGKIVMACMTPASDGTRISIDGEDARVFRENVIEWLMVNHPHDCPVCDEGGECHLQDMTLMSGHNYRRYRFTKRTHRNQDLGPFVNHEMNRCITCYRCVRYYRDYAGGRDLDAFAAHDHVYFGRSSDGTLENEFSGNLVEVCPTGVFTDKTLGAHYTRKWDLQSAPSVCVHCSVGCNTIAGERYGMLRRIANRYNYEVNGYFLCDRGRFGYEFVNGPDRVRTPRVRAGRREEFRDAGAAEAVQIAGDTAGEGNQIIGIGSPRATLEANFALRTLVGADRFFSGLPASEARLLRKIRGAYGQMPAQPASLHDIASSDMVVILGEDITNTAPMMALAVRQAVRNLPVEEAVKTGIPRWNDAAMREIVQDKTGPLVIMAPDATRLNDVASATFTGAPEDIARFGFALAGQLGGVMPAIGDLRTDLQAEIGKIATVLSSAQRPMIISGTSLNSEPIIDAALALAGALRASGKEAGLAFALAECNSMGASLLGGKDLEEAFDAVSGGGGTTVVILENDLYRRASRQAVDALLASARSVVVLDAVRTATTEAADVLFPASSFAEGDGTLVNYEGRAQRFFQVISPDGIVQESWRWLRDFMGAIGRSGATEWFSLDDVINALTNDFPSLRPVKDAAPAASYSVEERQGARQLPRYTGRTAMRANISVHEAPPPEDVDAPLRFSMEGFQVREESALIPAFWRPGWNSVQSTNKYQKEVGGVLNGGTPGSKLFPGAAGATEPAGPPPGAFRARENGLLLLPSYAIFGSEELSARAAALATRIPAATVALNPGTASRLGLKAGMPVVVATQENRQSLSLVVSPDVPDGIATIMAGLPGVEWFPFPSWGTVEKDSNAGI